MGAERVGRRSADPPGRVRRGEGRAGTLLWRGARIRSSALAWSDPIALALLAECGADALDLLRRDAQAAGGGRRTVERRLERRTSGRVVARSCACDGVAGLVAVTTVELEPPAPAGRADHGLSPRELEVARLAAEGHGNRAIAYRLGLATATVGVHLSRIFQKTGALDRQALTRLLFSS